MYEFCKDYEKMFENIVGSAYSYIASSKVKALVIGMSGGIDSALTAALAREVIDRLGTDISFIGRTIDIESTSPEINRAVNAMGAFCHGCGCDDMTKFYRSAIGELMWVGSDSDSIKDRIRRGNIKARLRMIKLYDLANSLDGMVLSTDNYTEYLLGFWTLHGDVGDFGMIQNLWKTEVYGLAEYLVTRFDLSSNHFQADALKECIEAVPTDGLGVTNSDFDQILPGYDKDLSPRKVYEQIDVSLAGHLNLITMHIDDYEKIRNENIIARHRKTKFKRTNPFNIPREYIIHKDGKSNLTLHEERNTEGLF